MKSALWFTFFILSIAVFVFYIFHVNERRKSKAMLIDIGNAIEANGGGVLVSTSIRTSSRNWSAEFSADNDEGEFTYEEERLASPLDEVADSTQSVLIWSGLVAEYYWKALEDLPPITLINDRTIVFHKP